MKHVALFFRQRALACFHRRRKYPLGSAERTFTTEEARMFLRDYRAAIDWREIERNAATLEIAAPVEATADERHQWRAWWKPSYEAAG
jgi:hypothetical protein